MAIKSYDENGKKVFEVYINGCDSIGRRFQRRKRSVESLRKAQTIEFEFKRELAQVKEEAVPFRWHEWFDECVKRMKIEYKPSTIYNYETQIKKWIHPHWSNIEIKNISKSDVYETIFNKCQDIVSQNNRKTILKMVKRLFQMAVEDGLIDRNPCIGVQVKVPEVEQKVLTNTEVEIFLKEAKLTDHKFYPIWALALMTGMRSGELFALKWTDIDFDSKIISVSKQWTSKNGLGSTKSGRTRIVPISDNLLHFLKEYKVKSSPEQDHVLPHYRDWQNGEQARVTREFCKAVGITPIKFHDLRATFITNLLARGESLARVMSLVGHSQLKTTNGYLRKAGVDVQGGTDKLGYKLPDLSGAKVLSLVR